MYSPVETEVVNNGPLSLDMRENTGRRMRSEEMGRNREGGGGSSSSSNSRWTRRRGRVVLVSPCTLAIPILLEATGLSITGQVVLDE